MGGMLGSINNVVDDMIIAVAGIITKFSDDAVVILQYLDKLL